MKGSKKIENFYLIKLNSKDCVVSRYYGKLSNGSASRGCWAIFEIDSGDMVDFNQYLNDLKSKYQF